MVQPQVASAVSSFPDCRSIISRWQSYGQGGLVTCIVFSLKTERPMIHLLRDWCSSNQRRVCHSFCSLETGTWIYLDDRWFYIKLTLHSVVERPENNELNVNSKWFYDTITTLHEDKDLRLWKTIHCIRYSFESKEHDLLSWIQGYVIISHTLTKFNPTFFLVLQFISVRQFRSSKAWFLCTSQSWVEVSSIFTNSND